MSDITECKGKDCTLKDNCKRYVEKDSFMQGYFVTTPFDHKNKTCEYYWSLNLNLESVIF